MERARSTSMSRAGLATLVVVASTWSLDASAHPNTPVPLFGEVPCMTVVDQAGSPVVEFPYAIEKPTGEIPPDNSELEDNHTLQFFALRRAFPGIRPNWIGEYDLDRVEALGIVDPDDLLPEHVLEWTPDLEPDEWYRIIADDARLPLTPNPDATLAWDTTDNEPGAYLVYGYSWEPPINLWTPRFGAVRLLADGDDPASGGPAVFLSVDLGATVDAGDDYTVRGCFDAAPGSELVLHWAARVPQPQWEWNEFARLEVQAGQLEVLLPTTPDLALQTLAIRADIVDPQGRSSSALAPVGVDVRPGAPVDAEGDSTGGDDEGETGDGSSTGIDDGGSSDETGTAPGSDDGGSGCSCQQSPRGAPMGWIGLLGLLFVARRRCPG